MGKSGRLILSIVAGALVLGTTSATAPLSERQQALHVLNRLGFGPRPGDVEAILKIGLDKYIEQQLYPERIDDTALQTRLSRYATLKMSERELFTRYWQPKRAADRAAAAERAESGAARPSDKRRMDGPRPQQVVMELSAARLDRALQSNRQLNEVMVDFWMNHFNVFAGKGLDRILIAPYERDTIRPHLWGRFEDLLMATAKSPAMLFYLDNARSVSAAENRPRMARGGRGNGLEERAKTRGLNENYARELLELHTLGVDGGYTQKDVTELARLLTGWSIARPQERGNGFLFRAALHDSQPKTVLGKRFPAGGGLPEGEAMIRYLATHPSTANHIAMKLCQRLVSDDPPPQLVGRVARRFLDTRGDLRETVRAVLTSPEFFDPAHYRAKVKSPFEYVVSAVRAVDGRVTNPRALARTLREMGQPLYFAQPPTGYSDQSEAWVNSGALMSRLNFALALAAAKFPGVEVEPDEAPIETVAERLVGGDLGPETRRTIEQQLAQEPVAGATAFRKSALAAGLILGSPEFQRQ